MPSNRLFLDDIRPCPAGWDVVRSYEEFVAYIEKNGVPEIISFDHDLGYISPNGVDCYEIDEHGNTVTGTPDPTMALKKSGLDCARWLIENHGDKIKACIVHSANPVGAENIRNAFKDFLRSKSDPRNTPNPA
jgi:hypothetical protein